MNDQQMDLEHSPVGPSSLAAIILCPGRVRMSEGIKDTTSFAAAQGTVAHEIGEKKLKGKRYPKVGISKIQDGHEIDIEKDMIDAVKVYVNHINSLKKGMDLHYTESIETSNSLAFLGLPEVFGTADYSLSIPFHTLYIRDYKHGSGVMVEAEGNPQLMAYALIAGQEMIETYDKINMGIVQPRTRDGEPIKVWETTPKDLLAWANDVLTPTVNLALSDNAPLNPGSKQCQWCRAKDICPVLAKKAMTIAQEDFKDFADFKPDQVVGSTPIEQVAKVYSQLPLLKQFIKAVEARVFNTLSVGDPVKGFKLVKGRRSRSWGDEIKAVKTLRQLNIDPYEMKLLTPAKAEKQLDKDGKKEVKRLISVSEGKPSIVKETDKREAITTAKDDFKQFKKD